VLTTEQIDSIAEKARTVYNVPGIAVAVIKDGKVIHSKGYGVRSLKTNQPVTENTLFGIASNSKAFTAVALGILSDEGKLTWDDKVKKFIPEFQLYDPYVTNEFTIRDLLTHRSGLGLGAGDLMTFPDSSDFTTKDIIYNLRYLKPVSSFRTKFDYDNLLYIVAGEIIKRVSGKSWEEFVEERILKPLVMRESVGTYNRLRSPGNIVDPHAAVEGNVRVIDRYTNPTISAAGGIYSSLADLTKWASLLLSNGKYEEGKKQLFSDKVLKEMWSPQTNLPVGTPGIYNTRFSAYGLGFFIADVKGYKQLSHTGGLPGMVTQITLLPELNLGIIVLTNQQEGDAYRAITNQVKESYFNMPRRDLVTTYDVPRKKNLEFAKHVTDSIWNAIEMVKKSETKNVNLSSYLGAYHDEWFGDVVISTKNGRTFFSSKRSPRLTGEVFPYKDDTFIVKWNDRTMEADAFVIFSKNKNGKKTGMTMKAVSPLTDFSYDFQDLNFTKVD